ncbi:MAG: gliding motility lipoprotein GldJ, partial [Bacteroidota bacterium]
MNLNLRMYPLIFISLLFIVSCGSQGGGDLGDTSPTTGWNYNDPENGGFEVNTDYEQEPGPGLVYIEGGTF